MVANRQADWALGEAFAIGSLLKEQVWLITYSTVFLIAIGLLVLAVVSCYFLA